MGIRSSFLPFTLLAFAVASNAAVHFQVWTTDTGLPQNSINDILQTHDGYLWMTTNDGLVRFDGMNFTVFDKANVAGLRGNRFTKLYEDRAGNLWVGTAGTGLSKYKDRSFTTYSTEDGLPSNSTWPEDNGQSNLLVRTTAGIVRWENGSFSRYTHGGNLGLSSFEAAYVDRSGDIWRVVVGVIFLKRSSTEVFYLLSKIPTPHVFLLLANLIS